MRIKNHNLYLQEKNTLKYYNAAIATKIFNQCVEKNLTNIAN